MGKRTQLIRHAAAAADAFEGLEGELTINLTNSSVRVHDGLLPGGVEMSRADLSNSANATTTNSGKMTTAQVIDLINAQTDISVLQTGLANEITNRVADVDAEEARAIAAEAGLQGQINTAVTNIGLNDTDISNLQAADITLQNNIDTEAATRAAADVTNGNAHDHAGGDGAQIPTAGIANLAVTVDKLAAQAVTAAKVEKSVGNGVVSQPVAGSGGTYSLADGVYFVSLRRPNMEFQIYHSFQWVTAVSSSPTTDHYVGFMIVWDSANMRIVNNAGTAQPFGHCQLMA